MATTYFNNNILAVARRLKSQRTDPTSNGDTDVNGNTFRYSSALLTQYENRAIRDLFKDKFLQMGKKIAGLFPEYRKTSGLLSPVAGTTFASVPVPADCWFGTDVSLSGAGGSYGNHCYNVPDDRVEMVKAGQDFGIVPSTSKPVWWQETGLICLLPATLTTQIYLRYFHFHTDISPVTGTTTAGAYLTSGTPTWTAATKTLAGGTYSASFTSADVGKWIVFRDSSHNAYLGVITSYVSANSVTVDGYGIPSGNVNVESVTKVDLSGSDLTINPSWFGEIQDRMVQIALSDTKAIS